MTSYLGMDFADTLNDAAYRLQCSQGDLEMFSWPEVFGSTAGPRKGIGGSAMTTFQVYAFRDGSKGSVKGVKYCFGVRKEWSGDMQEAWGR